MTSSHTPELDPDTYGPLQGLFPNKWRNTPVVWLGAIALTWVPMLVLSFFSKSAAGDRLIFSFLSDSSIYVRFLLASPLLIAAGPVIGGRIQNIFSYFGNSEIFSGDAAKKFDLEVQRFLNIRKIFWIDVALVVASLVMSWVMARVQFASGFSAWIHDPSGGLADFTIAGWWYVVVGQPFWLYLVFRWGWQLTLWGNFLKRVAKLDLNLVPTHPDRAGGLGILGGGQMFFALLPLALSFIVATQLGEFMVSNTVDLREVIPTIVVYVLLSLIVILGPLLTFSPQLVRAKHRGMVKYGDLGDILFRAFDNKWTVKNKSEQETLLGNVEPSTLADFGATYEIVSEMRVVPFSKKNAVFVAASTLIPFAPLLLIKYSVKDIVQGLLGILG